MPKLKSNRGAAKRLKFLASGKVLRTHSHLRHILTKKSSSRKRKLRGTALLFAGDVGHARQMLPYGKR